MRRRSQRLSSSADAIDEAVEGEPIAPKLKTFESLVKDLSDDEGVY